MWRQSGQVRSDAAEYLHRAENEPSTRGDTYGSLLMDAAQNVVHGVGAIQSGSLEHRVPGVIALFVHCTVMVVNAVPGGDDLDCVIG